MKKIEMKKIAEKIELYQDNNGNTYLKTGREEGFMVRISDGTRHDGTTTGEFHIISGHFQTEEYAVGLAINNDESLVPSGQTVADIKRTIDVLKEIAKGEGAYNMDRLTWANNTIESMKKLAEHELTQLNKEV